MNTYARIALAIFMVILVVIIIARVINSRGREGQVSQDTGAGASEPFGNQDDNADQSQPLPEEKSLPGGTGMPAPEKQGQQDYQPPADSQTKDGQRQSDGGQSGQDNQPLSAEMMVPLSDGLARVTKKPFGIQTSPGQSPVDPERFTGFHTGIDFEISPQELDQTVEVRAICDGAILFLGRVGGYGGTVVQSCQLSGFPVTVVYGHLSFNGYNTTVDDTLALGQPFAKLGDDRSYETDGERKHLHLGVHKGAAVDLRGYATSPNELSLWVDPAAYIDQVNRSIAGQ